ncbi:MAG: rRNA maturation RNase YbeY [Candidatus Eremiobacteraeota bacterium]|nr:rRNA maturation RNase YbeY [Candidatus Eremiobacteraeota bacterium]NNM93115.1 rRNA maturation RNase YbeY [Candidatus Eremiobacteraeota bacterium]
MIHYRNTVRKSGVDARAVKRTAEQLLAAVGRRGASLSISFVGDEEIARINAEHRGKNRPTDVLSFPLEPDPSMPGEELLGDVVISVPTARRQAAEYDAPLQREVERLLIHGLLHVLGHDHEAPEERDAMIAEERQLAATIGMPWPYDP